MRVDKEALEAQCKSLQSEAEKQTEEFSEK